MRIYYFLNCSLYNIFYTLSQENKDIIGMIEEPPNQENLEYPVLWSKVDKHTQANKISKLLTQQNLGQCQCCHRKLGKPAPFTIFEDVQKKYGAYGPNVVFYFGAIKRIMLLLLLGSLIFTIWAMWSNFQGDFCINNQKQCQFNHTVYIWSIYNIIQNRDSLFVQLLLWIGVSILILIFNLGLRYYFVRNYERINNNNITDADFSIIVRRLPFHTLKSDLYNLVKNLMNDVSDQDLKRSQHLQVRDVIMIYKMKATVDTNKKNLKDFKQAIKKDQVDNFVQKQAPKQRDFAKTAIIRFHSIHANEVLKFKTNWKERLLHYFFPFVNPRTQYRVRGKRVAIEQAPEPTDIIWDHFGYTERGKIKRKILFTALGLLVLCFSCGVLYGLAKANDAITDANGNVPVYFSIIMTLFPFAFNHIIGMILISATTRHRLDNKTEQYIEEMQKIILYQAINLGFFSLFLPFIVKLPNLRDGAQSLSLPYITLMSTVTQAFISPTTSFVLTYFGIYPRIWKFLVKHDFLTVTQREANGMFEGPHIEFGGNYTTLVMIVWFTFLFAIVSPICLPISVLGLILYYVYEKIMLNRRYVIPEYGGSRLNSEFVDLLDVTPLLISLFNIFLHYVAADILEQTLTANVIVALYVNLGIGILIFLIPWSDVITICNVKIKSDCDVTYDQIKSQLDITYEQLNPFVEDPKKVRNIDRKWGNRSKFDQLFKSRLKSALPSERNFFDFIDNVSDRPSQQQTENGENEKKQVKQKEKKKQNKQKKERDNSK